MKNNALILVAAAILLAPTAHATSIDCGDPSLGTRTLKVSPALACRDAGLINLGDSGLEALSFVDEVLERDTANSNGGLLDITGVGGFSGGWTIGASVWDDWEDVFSISSSAMGRRAPVTIPTGSSSRSARTC